MSSSQSGLCAELVRSRAALLSALFRAIATASFSIPSVRAQRSAMKGCQARLSDHVGPPMNRVSFLVWVCSDAAERRSSVSFVP